MEALGIEGTLHVSTSTGSPCINEIGDANDGCESTHPPESEGFGPTFGPASATEAALARALNLAAAAGRFDVVAQLAEELKARRLAAAGNVVELDARKRRGP